MAPSSMQPGRSVRTFVAPHVGHEVVLRMDLEDFFASTARDPDRIRGRRGSSTAVGNGGIAGIADGPQQLRLGCVSAQGRA